MTSVTYSFNLDPVVSAASQRTYSAPTESNAAISAKYQAAQPTFHLDQGMASVASPACEGGGCYVVHGDGPGVTTLSIGEEDGGTSDFLSLPIVDGVQFMEPPVTSFASAGDYQISTLAIGEEDSGFASAAPEIGATETAMTAPVSNAVEFVEQMAIEPMPMAKPEMPSFQAASAFDGAPVPASKPEVFYSAAPTSTSMPIANTSMPVADTSMPLADTSASAPVANGSGDLAGQEFVSVGDYDSYFSTTGAGGTPSEAAAVAPAPAETAPTPVYTINETAPVQSTATQTAPSPQPAETTQETASPRVELVFQPATGATATPGYTIQEVAPQSATVQPSNAEIESLNSPRMDPATLTTPGPAMLGPINLEPIDTAPTTTMPVDESSLGITPPQQTFIDSGTTIGALDSPYPSGKPEGIAGDVPRLSEDDYRITTLALGEEDAGGG